MPARGVVAFLEKYFGPPPVNTSTQTATRIALLASAKPGPAICASAIISIIVLSFVLWAGSPRLGFRDSGSQEFDDGEKDGQEGDIKVGSEQDTKLGIAGPRKVVPPMVVIKNISVAGASSFAPATSSHPSDPTPYHFYAPFVPLLVNLSSSPNRPTPRYVPTAVGPWPLRSSRYHHAQPHSLPLQPRVAPALSDIPPTLERTSVPPFRLNAKAAAYVPTAAGPSSLPAILPPPAHAGPSFWTPRPYAPIPIHAPPPRARRHRNHTRSRRGKKHVEPTDENAEVPQANEAAADG